MTTKNAKITKITKITKEKDTKTNQFGVLADSFVNYVPFVIFMTATVIVAACGGGGGNGSPSPSPSPGGGGAQQNPCTTAAVLDEELATRAGDENRPPRDKTRVDGSMPWRVLDDVYAHRAAALRGQAITVPQPNNADVGQIAVLQDQGDLVVRANAFDLGGVGLRFTRNNGGGYDVQKIDANFRTTLGTRLTLSDDDSRGATVPFNFQFYGQAQTSAFVNSDGNITFGEQDNASTDRNVTRLLAGAPRIAPFLADLDPSTGGSVWVNATSSEFTVTYCNVKGFESSQVATVQATALPDGSVEMKLASTTNLPEAVIGISPGHTGVFAPVNLSDQGPTAGGGAAVGERFSDSSQLDTVAVAKRFYQDHPDNFDQLVMWTDTRLQRTSFAYESTVKNQVRGLGIDVYDIASEFGSGGTLRSVVAMDALTKYPDDPTVRTLGQNNTLSILGQETGHLWLAYLNFRNASGVRSDALLGRDQAHWSFFMDSDGSVMEGNDWEDLGGGKFVTHDPVKRYSRLDQYAMGLVGAGDVPPFFYIESPVNTNKAADDAPISAGFNLTGTRRDVLIQDIIAAMGSRSPGPDQSPKVHRQAFIYVITTANPAAGQVEKLERIRAAWEPFFFEATERRMTLTARLNP
ncbi:MAG: hypothetical protein ACM36C_00750 [Acidobacteriota bacterium]